VRAPGQTRRVMRTHRSHVSVLRLFYGSSMLLAAARGYAGCEVPAASNWVLRRDDQVGCVLFWPVDETERRLLRDEAP
jgi:hypothetical protein